MKTQEDKDKYAAYMRDYRKKNPRIMKAIDLKKNFGISLEDYESMLESQGGLCKICKLPERALDHRTKQPRQLAVDHCHISNRVRGLLCSDCNLAIGKLKDDPTLVEAALAYLRA